MVSWREGVYEIDKQNSRERYLSALYRIIKGKGQSHIRIPD